MYGGRVCDEKAMKVAASEAWELIGTLQLAKFVVESVPDLFSKVEVLEGDGGAGTILRVSLAPVSGGGMQFKEKFVVVDDEKRVKVTEVVEGGYLDLGFTLYRFTLEVIEAQEKKHCIVRSTIEYELQEGVAAVVSIQPLTAIMDLAADFLYRNYNN